MANAKGDAPDNVQPAPSEENETEVGTEEHEGTPPESSEDVEEEEGTESEGEGVEQYFEISKVPPQLKPIATKMQATHTRKMQSMAQHVRMGLALGELVKHPNWEGFIKDVEAGKPYGHGSIKQSSRTVEPDEEDEDPGTSPKKLDTSKVMSELTPLIQKMVAEAIAPLVDDRAKTEWSKFAEAHPDIDDYRPDIVKIMREHPGISLKRAYRLAKDEDDEITSSRKASEKPRKPNKTEKPTSSKEVGLSPETAETLDAALRGAMRQQGFRAR